MLSIMSKVTNNILKISNSKKTVFSTNELALFWKIVNKKVLHVTINRYLKKGYLKKIRRGLYSLKNREVNLFELANKMKKYSYISFETVLVKEGIIFQWHDTVFSASLRSDEEKNDFGKFKFISLPEKYFFNNDGIAKKGEYFIATKERAFCDKIYKDGLSYFDDITCLDRKKIFKLSKNYNKRLENDIKKILA